MAATSLRTYDVVTGTGTTTGAVTSTLVTWTVPSGASVTFDMTVTGRETTSGDTVSRRMAGAAKSVTGVAALVGTLTSLLSATDATLIGATASVTNSAGTLIGTVTGVALRTIVWEMNINVQIN